MSQTRICQPVPGAGATAAEVNRQENSSDESPPKATSGFFFLKAGQPRHTARCGIQGGLVLLFNLVVVVIIYVAKRSWFEGGSSG